MNLNTGTHPSRRTRSILMLLAAAILWSTGGLIIKWIPWNPFAIAGTRSAIAAAIILIYIRRPKFTWSIHQLGGALSYAITVILFVVSNKLTTAANAIVLQYTCPIFVAVLASIFLAERTTFRAWLAVLSAMSGILLFFLDKLTAGGMLGNILSIISGLSLAFLVIFLRKQKNASPVESILLGNILTVILCAPFVLSSDITALSGQSLAALGVLGIFQLGISYILYATAIKYIPALDAILIPIIEPLLNPLWVFLFIGEKPGIWSFAGGVVVLSSVTVYCIIENNLNSRQGR